MSVFAAATGIGSWPGSSAREAAEIVVGELHTLTHLVELPDRGVGADLIGRAGALLVDISIDTGPRGYRVFGRRSAAARRSASLLEQDIDALEEAWEKAGLPGGGRAVKVQAPGPVTLAAGLELPNGHRAITDSGALRDLAASLAEGVAAHRARLARRLDSTVVVQLDEPFLPAALQGRLTGVTGLSAVHPVDDAVATGLLQDCVAKAGTEVMVHCCSAGLPWKLLQRSTVHAVSVDATALKPVDLDGAGEFIEAGGAVMLGLVPSTRPGSGDRRAPSVEEIAAAAARFTDGLSFPRSVLPERIGITPTCGLAGATGTWARTAIGLAERAAEMLADDAEAIQTGRVSGRRAP